METITTLLQETFNFPQIPLIATVATAGPKQRSMRIFDFEKDEYPLLFSHTGATKWKIWEKDPSISLLILSEDKKVQIIAQGKGELKQGTQEQWEMMRPDVRQIYHESYLVEGPYQSSGELEAPQHVPFTFGCIRMIPSCWEVLELELPYLASKRVHYRKEGSSWSAKRIHVG